LRKIEEITEKDCINYVIDLVIKRSYAGYKTEIQTIYGQLEAALETEIKPAPDKWDRLYNVDFFITVGQNSIGLQIKPVANTSQIPQIFKERDIQANTHREFQNKYGGKVFYVISETVDKRKRIQNPEVIEQIKVEISRLC